MGKIILELETDGLLSFKQAGELLGTSHVTISNWVRAKKICAIRLAGNEFIPITEVERLKKVKKKQ